MSALRYAAFIFIVLGIFVSCEQLSMLKSAIEDVVESYNEEPLTYSVTYVGSDSSAGSEPVDGTPYEEGDTVIVHSQGSLVGEQYYPFFDGWDTVENGSGTRYFEGWTFLMPAADVILYSKWETYRIGDNGPAGGIIFYDDEADGADDLPGDRFLEVAPASTEWASYRWGYDTDLVGVTVQDGDIGQGENDTDIIVDDFLSPTIYSMEYAAWLCYSLAYNGYTDWFLPSQDELDEMYQTLHLSGYGGFSNVTYWSSTEGWTSIACSEDFSDGARSIDNKELYRRVRAVRSF